MIALKRYITHKFDNPSVFIDELDEWVIIDIRNENNLFDCPCISFDTINRKVYADIPVNIINIKNAILKLVKYGFVISEIHNHNKLQHIHIEGLFDKSKIDLLSDIFK